MRSIVPTKRLWIVLAFGLLLGVGGAFVPGLERLMLLYDLGVFLIFCLTAFIAAKWPVVKVSRRFDQVMSVRQLNEVELSIESTAPYDLNLRLLDSPPANFETDHSEFNFRLSPRQVIVRTYRVKPQERGDQEFGETYVRFDAPLGLAAIQKSLGNDEATRVYPNIKAVKEFDFLKQKGKLKDVGVRQTRMKGLGTEFESLREYNDDDFRLIDWKSTARRGRLVVKNFEQERNQSVLVCLDLGRHMLGDVENIGKVDHALDAALMVFHAAERNGDMVGVFAFNDAVRAYAAPKKGRSQVSAVLGACYALYAEPVQPDYAKAFAYLSSRWKKRSLIVFFTDAENLDQAQEIVSALAHVRKRHLLMLVRVKDPRIDSLMQEQIDEKTLFSRAAATWYQSDRQQAASHFAAAGIHSIEAEPQELAAALVNAYLQAKQLALI